jgi:hypothetical protein
MTFAAYTVAVILASCLRAAATAFPVRIGRGIDVLKSVGILVAAYRHPYLSNHQAKWETTMRARLLQILSAISFAIATAASSLPAAATTSINYSDLWVTQGEAGWGLNISQQADILFGTFFVYGAGNQPAWYSGTFTYQATLANGVVVYGGNLYQTTGPSIEAPFNPALVGYTQVGLVTLEFGDDAHAQLRYTVNSTVVVKQITRLTFASQSLTGTYVGGTTDITFDCTDPLRNNLVTTDVGQFTISQEGGDLVLRLPTCTYTGQYTQQGQIGHVEGFYFCTNLANGVVTFTGMQDAKGGIVGNYTGRDNSCSFRGNIGGVRLIR